MAGITHRLKVKLKGGGPWGFRLLGGAGTGLPLTVAKVRRKSKSYKNLQEGDLFVRVNDVPCSNLTYEQVMCIADKSGAELRLEIERKETVKENVTTNVSTCPPPIENYQPQTTTNMTKHFEETKTSVTDTTKMEDVKAKPNVTNVNQQDIMSNQHSTFEKSSFPESEKKETIKSTSESKEILFEKPDFTSDISTKTTTEITPNSEKFEKVQTEKLHEKLDNKETTIIRTDYEEVIKSHDATTTSIPTTIPLIVIPTEETKKENESPIKSITKESYECTTSETEVTTTTKVNGYPFQLDDDLSRKIENVTVPKSASIFGSDTVVTNLDNAATIETTDSFSTWDKQFDSSIIKKKKMFSSSSFYEEPQAIYPTMEEQVEMAKKIAESLADDTNKKSKGANMFFKRAKRSTKWIHEGPEPSDNSEPATPDIISEPFYPEYYVDSNQKRNDGQKLKLVLDPRHPIDAASLRSTGHKISEHNVVSPEVCHGLVRDLESPKGKGSALFAKRKKKSSEWVVDEEKVKSLMKSQEKNLEQLTQNTAKENVAPFKSPFDTFELPYKRYDSALNRVHPERLAETVIQAAECKRRDSIQSNEESRYETCMSPIIPATPAASYYDIYKAKAPTGWSSSSVVTNPAFSTPSAKTEASDQLPYYSATLSSVPRKYQFQNFNTLPRKWKSPY